MVFTGYTYSPSAKDEIPTYTQNATIAPCPGIASGAGGCQMQQVSFPDSFRSLSGLQIQAFVGNTERIFFVDDLALAWSNNTCEAGLTRLRYPSSSRSTLEVKDSKGSSSTSFSPELMPGPSREVTVFEPPSEVKYSKGSISASSGPKLLPGPSRKVTVVEPPSETVVSPLYAFCAEDPQIWSSQDDLTANTRSVRETILDIAAARARQGAEARLAVEKEVEAELVRRRFSFSGSSSLQPLPLRTRRQETASKTEQPTQQWQATTLRLQEDGEAGALDDKHTFALTDETQRAYQKLGKQRNATHQEDRRPPCPSVWLRSSLSRADSAGKQRRYSSLKLEWNPKRAGGSRTSSLPSIVRKRPAIPVGLSRSSAASAIRDGKRPVYSKPSSLAASVVESECEAEPAAEFASIPEPAVRVPEAQTTDKGARQQSIFGKLKKIGSSASKEKKVRKRPSSLFFWTASRASDGQDEQLERAEDPPAGENCFNFFGNLLGPPSRNHSPGPRNKVKRVESTPWWSRSADAGPYKRPRATTEVPPVLQLGTRGDEDFPAGAWSSRLSRALELDIPAAQGTIGRRRASCSARGAGGSSQRVRDLNRRRTWGYDLAAASSLVDISMMDCGRYRALSLEAISPMTSMVGDLPAGAAVLAVSGALDAELIASYRMAQKYCDKIEDQSADETTGPKAADRLDSGAVVD
ncbi:hypothetical protein LTR08_004742 [Meristemomyces frigidus]|nr:hypothetical protein LTR08_004742 [Meristemomyces frigidus]